LEFVECIDDLGVGDVVAEHAVDHVADGVRESGDFAVAGAGLDTGCRILDAGWIEVCCVLRDLGSEVSF
jgi:hypothetical protein